MHANIQSTGKARKRPHRFEDTCNANTHDISKHTETHRAAKGAKDNRNVSRGPRKTMNLTVTPPVIHSFTTFAVADLCYKDGKQVSF